MVTPLISAPAVDPHRPAPTSCEWAACTRPAAHHLDGWWHCRRHVHEHLAEQEPVDEQVLTRADDWLLSRLGRGGLLTDLVNGLLNLYAPPEPNTAAAATTPSEAHA